jgi:formylglycine-generating enzyme required for sulfatase activity
MVAVPAGTFTMGTAEITPGVLEECVAQIGGEPDPARNWCRTYLGREQAVYRLLSVEAFALDKTEVTNADFAAWLSTQNTKITEESDFRLVVDYSGRELLWLSFADGIEVRDGRFSVRPGFDRMPAAGVSWFGAEGYCQARGKRLPSEIEWEYAARGPSSNRWVQGNRRPECGDSVFGRMASKEGQKASCEGASAPLAVGTTERDVSWCGARDMGGNVSEWVATALSEDGVERWIYKGGAFSDSWLYTRPATRNLQPARRGAKTLGFRCARDGHQAHGGGR